MESIVFPSSSLVGPAGMKFERRVFKNTVHYTEKLGEEETEEKEFRKIKKESSCLNKQSWRWRKPPLRGSLEVLSRKN